MKVGTLSNVIVLTAKWLRIFGFTGFIVFLFLSNRSPLFDPSIEPLTENQAKFVALKAMREYGWSGDVEVLKAKQVSEGWKIWLNSKPHRPSEAALVEISNDIQTMITRY